MQPNEQNATLIAKVQKLMALAQNNPSEAEANLAAQRVQELLIAHNLTMAQVESTGKESSKPADTGQREKTAHTSAAMYKYQRDLMETLARNNFCMHWIQEQYKEDPRAKHEHWVGDKLVKARLAKTHVLLGRDVNVLVTRLTYDYLIETMDRLLPWQGMQKRGKDALLWLAGCTERLVERLNEQRWKMERETSRVATEQEGDTNGNALVSLKDLYGSEEELNQDFRYGQEPGTTASRRRQSAMRYAEESRKEAEFVAKGYNASDAWYLARGWEVPNKTEQDTQPIETEAQRRKREAKEQRESDARRAKWQREANKENERRNSEAFRMGRSTGSDIGLDAQVPANTQRKGIA